MNARDNAPLIAIAMLASRADGATGSAEQRAVDAVVARIGNPEVTRLAGQVESGQIGVAELARMLSDDEARRIAYEGALSIVDSDGVASAAEQAFLRELREALGISAAAVEDVTNTAETLAATEVTGESPRAEPQASMDDFILQQSILTGALEVLPDRIASVAILPLQLRMVYQIGGRHSQRLDANQVKDLAAVLGLGAAAQSVQGAALRLIGGLAGGLLGGVAGGATRVATGAVMTFATTWALGHVADRYYQRGRNLSREDLRSLYEQFQTEARTIYPRVEEQVRRQAATLDLRSLLQGLAR
jgi:uncharacterized protein (DUF697 family)/tellurite resistance protein